MRVAPTRSARPHPHTTKGPAPCAEPFVPTGPTLRALPAGRTYRTETGVLSDSS